MEILIQIPPWVVDIWESLCSRGDVTYLFLVDYSLSVWEFITYERNPLWLALSMIVFWPLWVYFAVAVSTASTWIFWLFASALLGIIQVIYVTYQFLMISADIMVLTFLKTYQVLMRSRYIQFLFFFSKKIRNSRRKTSQRRKWRGDCEHAKTYGDFLHLKVLEPKTQETVILTSPKSKQNKRSHSFATLQTLYEEQQESPSVSPSKMRRRSSFDRKKIYEELVENDLIDPSIVKDLGNMTTELLLTTTARLKEARCSFSSDEDDSGLKLLLPGVVKRNHLTLEDLLVNNARSVASSGQYEFSPPSRKAVATYYDEVSKGLESLAEEPITCSDPLVELRDRMTLIRKMKQNMGRTALMLSGGGAQAMYHLGTMRALIESNVYDDIKVISGTSGGSITAACCAMYTAKEMYEDICLSTISTDFRLNGEMKRKKIAWFPPVMDMVAYWLKRRLLVDSKYFYRTCDYYFGTTTFEEAYERTGKQVCITVTASRATGSTAQRLLLNHISTPHVTLASAVAASCALPGVMKPAKLQTKSSTGEIEAFEVDGVEWIDGSVQADLPFQRISTLFNVSNYVVCQTNFHVIPFLNKEYHPTTRSIYWKIFQTIEWDIRNRALKLGRLGLFPKIFGQDMTKVFKQKYHGHLTLVPRFTAAQTFGLKALVNPSVKEMEGYLKYGQLAAWPYLGVIRDMIRLETALDECLERLKNRCHQLYSDFDMSESDDLDSIASNGVNLNRASFSNRVVRFAGQDREVERAREKLAKAEEEILSLRTQVRELKSHLGQDVDTRQLGEEKKTDEKDGESALNLSEGGVWNLVQQLNFTEKTDSGQ